MLKYLLFITMLLFSTNNSYSQKLSNFFVKEKIFCLGLESKHDAFYLSSVESNKGKLDFLFRFIKDNYHLEIYNLSDACNLKSIKIQQNGPNGVGVVFAFFAKDENNFIFVDMNGIITDFNIEKGVTNKYNLFRNNEDKADAIFSTALGRIEIFNVEDNLFLPVTARNPNEYKSLSEFKFYWKFNVTSKIGNKLNASFPDKYWNSDLKSLAYSSAYNNKSKKVVLSPLNSSDIFEMSLDGKITGTYNPKSKNLKKYDHWRGIAYSEREYYDRSMRYGKNLSIAYDKYRNVFYQFYWPGDDPEKFEELVSLNDLRYSILPYFGILILDDKFNVIGDVRADSFTYQPFQYFITKDGLFIQADHPNNKDICEDELKFHLFDFSKLKIKE